MAELATTVLVDARRGSADGVGWLSAPSYPPSCCETRRVESVHGLRSRERWQSEALFAVPGPMPLQEPAQAFDGRTERLR